MDTRASLSSRLTARTAAVPDMWLPSCHDCLHPAKRTADGCKPELVVNRDLRLNHLKSQQGVLFMPMLGPSTALLISMSLLWMPFQCR
jgi:hypothetical protein